MSTETVRVFNLLTVDDHLFGERNFILKRRNFARVVAAHVRRGRVQVQGPMPSVRIWTDLVVQIDFATHLAETLEKQELNWFRDH